MRFETHRVGEAVVWRLQATPSVQQVLVDGGDIIECRLATGEIVSIHLIESNIELYEAAQILTGNDARGVATLFMFWRDMLLPDHGQRVALDPWLAAWLTLYDGKIYGYDIDGPVIELFPVFMEARADGWTARFGPLVDFSRLVVRQVQVGGALAGVWRIAAFDGDADSAHAQAWNPNEHTVEELYAIFDLEVGATRVRVKSAYRRLARRLHPDINPAPDANARMQALNAAYRTLLDSLDEDSP